MKFIAVASGALLCARGCTTLEVFPGRAKSGLNSGPRSSVSGLGPTAEYCFQATEITLIYLREGLLDEAAVRHHWHEWQLRADCVEKLDRAAGPSFRFHRRARRRHAMLGRVTLPSPTGTISRPVAVPLSQNGVNSARPDTERVSANRDWFALV